MRRSPLVLLLASLLASFAPGTGEPNHDAAFATIQQSEVEEHLSFIASPELEGRDSPSAGLLRAGQYIAEHFTEAGLEYAPDSQSAWSRVLGGGEKAPDWSTPHEEEGTYLRPYRIGSLGSASVRRPTPDKCSLELSVGEGERTPYTFGEHFVPVAGGEGRADGELIWAGFGIDSKTHKYSDFKGLKLAGKVAMILDGEPRHRRKFDGPEATRAASIWKKLGDLRDAKVSGVLIVRRPPQLPKGVERSGETLPLRFRTTWATWNAPGNDRAVGSLPPTLEITPECATELLGRDVLAVAAKIDKSAKPSKVKLSGRHIRFESQTAEGGATIHNLVGLVRGSDPALADEYVIVGAHYDHVGVGPRGRVGPGADDNGSGTSALIEVAEAMAVSPPRRSVLLCAFSAEEDGLVGSRQLCRALPVDKDKIVGMVNLDMIGRGVTTEVVALGFVQNPGLEDVVTRARRLGKTGVKKVTKCKDRELFKRSDHYSFHEVGIPAVFFFEAVPISKNEDYHTWRDTVDKVDMKKVANTARLAFNTAWILANDDDRPVRPRD